MSESIEVSRSAAGVEVVEMGEMNTLLVPKKLLLDMDCC
jgi:hypothetical protein